MILAEILVPLVTMDSMFQLVSVYQLETDALDMEMMELVLYVSGHID